jgi:hypothetical protein
MDNKGFKVTDKRNLPDEVDNKLAMPKAEEVEIPKTPDYSKINIKMKGDRMLLQQFPATEKFGHLILPNGLGGDIDKGRVCAIGEDVKHINVGDVIFKVEGLGRILEDKNGDVYIFLPENAAIAVDTSFSDE